MGHRIAPPLTTSA